MQMSNGCFAHILQFLVFLKLLLYLKKVGLSWIKAAEINSSILHRVFAKKWPKYTPKNENKQTKLETKQTTQQNPPHTPKYPTKAQETWVLYL